MIFIAALTAMVALSRSADAQTAECKSITDPTLGSRSSEISAGC
jgi:hypothetical protein